MGRGFLSDNFMADAVAEAEAAADGAGGRAENLGGAVGSIRRPRTSCVRRCCHFSISQRITATHPFDDPRGAARGPYEFEERRGTAPGNAFSTAARARARGMTMPHSRAREMTSAGGGGRSTTGRCHAARSASARNSGRTDAVPGVAADPRHSALPPFLRRLRSGGGCAREHPFDIGAR